MSAVISSRSLPRRIFSTRPGPRDSTSDLMICKSTVSAPPGTSHGQQVDDRALLAGLSGRAATASTAASPRMRKGK